MVLRFDVYCDFSASSRVCQARVAHLTRAGKCFTLVRRLSSSNSGAERRAWSGLLRVQMDWKSVESCLAEETDFPLRSLVMMETEAMEMAQPSPSKQMWSILSLLILRLRETRSPQIGLSPSAL